MKQVVDKQGSHIADLDDENRIVDGHHRVYAHQQLGHEMFIKDGDKLVPAFFQTGIISRSIDVGSKDTIQ